jgi:hypothetical protein
MGGRGREACMGEKGLGALICTIIRDHKEKSRSYVSYQFYRFHQ